MLCFVFKSLIFFFVVLLQYLTVGPTNNCQVVGRTLKKVDKHWSNRPSALNWNRLLKFPLPLTLWRPGKAR